MTGWNGRKVTKLVNLVLATYGSVCHLCGGLIDPEAKPHTPGYKSADHLIPRSQGGADTLENLRPAHLGCNSRRGTKPLGAVRKHWQSTANW